MVHFEQKSFGASYQAKCWGRKLWMTNLLELFKDVISGINNGRRECGVFGFSETLCGRDSVPFNTGMYELLDLLFERKKYGWQKTSIGAEDEKEP